MFVSDKWETISEISERKNCKYLDAYTAVKSEFKNGLAVMRFTEGDSGCLEFRLKK